MATGEVDGENPARDGWPGGSSLDQLRQYNQSGVVCSLELGRALVEKSLQVDFNDAAVISTAEGVMGRFAAGAPRTYTLVSYDESGAWVANRRDDEGFLTDQIDINVPDKFLEAGKEVQIASAVGYEARLVRAARQAGTIRYVLHKNLGQLIGGPICGFGVGAGVTKVVFELQNPPTTAWELVVPVVIAGSVAVAGLFMMFRLKPYETMAKRMSKQLSEQRVPNILFMPRETMEG